MGGALPWLFSSLIIRAVGRAAGLIVQEVRQQFHIPGIMEGKVRPDYARVIGISTTAAQKELIPLAILCLLIPIVIGLVFQVEALGGFLAGIILSGQLLAVFMAIAGGAVMPLVMGAVNDAFGISAAMLVPFLSCLYILLLGLRSSREAQV